MRMYVTRISVYFRQLKQVRNKEVNHISMGEKSIHPFRQMKSPDYYDIYDERKIALVQIYFS